MMASTVLRVVLLCCSFLLIECDNNAEYDAHIEAILKYLNANPYKTYEYKARNFVSAQLKADIVEITTDIQADCTNRYPDVPCSSQVLTCHGFVRKNYEQNDYQVLSDVTCRPKIEIEIETEPNTFYPPSYIVEPTNTKQNFELSHEAVSNEQSAVFVAIRRDTVPCAGCPLNLNTQAQGVDELVHIALKHVESENTRRHALVKILSVQQQIVAGVKYVLLLEVAPTQCPKDADVSSACPLDVAAGTTVCKVTYITKPWISKAKHIIKNNCTISQEYTNEGMEYQSNDMENEIDGGFYQRKASNGPMEDDAIQNYDAIAEKGNMDDATLKDLESQIIIDDMLEIPSGNKQEFSPVAENIPVEMLGERRDDKPMKYTEFEGVTDDVRRESDAVEVTTENVNGFEEEVVQIGGKLEKEETTSEIPIAIANRRNSEEVEEEETNRHQKYQDISEERSKVRRSAESKSASEKNREEKHGQQNSSEDSSEEKAPKVRRSAESNSASEENDRHQNTSEESSEEKAPKVKRSAESNSASEESKEEKDKRQNTSEESSEEKAPKVRRSAESNSASEESKEENDRHQNTSEESSEEKAPKVRRSAESNSASEESKEEKDKHQNTSEESSEEKAPKMKRSAESNSASEENDRHHNISEESSEEKAPKVKRSAESNSSSDESNEEKDNHKNTSEESVENNSSKTRRSSEEGSKQNSEKNDEKNDKSSSSSSTSSEGHQESPRAKRSVGKLEKITSDEKLIVTNLAEFAASSLDAIDDDEQKRVVLQILGAKKLKLDGVYYQIIMRLGVSECLEHQYYEKCKDKLITNLTKVCKVQVHVDDDLSNPKMVKSQCQNIKRDRNDKNRTHYSRYRRQVVGGPVEGSRDDPIVEELIQHSLTHIDSKSKDTNKYKVVELKSFTKQVVAGVKYVLTVDVALTDCKKEEDKSLDECPLLDNSERKTCKVTVWDRSWLDKRQTTIKCGNDIDLTFESKISDSQKKTKKTRLSRESPFSGSYDFELTKRKPKSAVGDDVLKLFDDFTKKHKKSYINHQEYRYRLKVFRDNLNTIETLNKYEQGTATYGITKFTDLTPKEFSQSHGLRHDLRHENEVPFVQAEIPDVELPDEFDWRLKGAVTPVKNQGSCGSCWAFSVTGDVEGQYAIKHGKLLSFSEQELVDCDKTDDGCNGGLMDNAYRAIEKLGGLELESDYQYEGSDDKCQFNKSKVMVQLKGAVNISHDETEMAKWLVQNGPISIAINANAMQFYMGGVSHPWKILCNPNNLDHGVLIVGYGVHTYPKFNKTLPYWIVKNSWSTSWGEQGYYRVYRGGGTCGLNQTPSSAIVA